MTALKVATVYPAGVGVAGKPDSGHQTWGVRGHPDALRAFPTSRLPRLFSRRAVVNLLCFPPIYWLTDTLLAYTLVDAKRHSTQ